MGKNHEDVDQYKKGRVRDIIIIVVAIIIVVGLGFLISYLQKKQQDEENQSLIQGLTQVTETEERVEQDSAASNILINEINEAGWLELYNPSKVDAELSGCVCLLNGTEVSSVNTSIASAGFFVVDLKRNLTKNDFVQVMDSQGDTIVDILVPDLSTSESYGRTTDGGDSFKYLYETKEATNDAASEIAKSNIYFDKPNGFYLETFSTSIVIPDGYNVYYTIDGTEPNMEDSLLYTGEISVSQASSTVNNYSAITGLSSKSSYVPSDKVDKSMIIRAKAFSANGSALDEVTAEYFINVQNKSQYSELPIISISANPYDLFDYFDGILMTGVTYENALASGEDTAGQANFYLDKQVPVSIRFYEKGNSISYEGSATLETYDDGYLDSIQKSLYITLDNETSIGCALNDFAGVGGSFVLEAGEEDSTYKTRDYLLKNLLEGTDATVLDIQPAMLFLNGEFWGLYYLKGDANAEYLSEKYSINSETVLIDTYLRDNYWAVADLTEYDFSGVADDLYAFVATKNLKKEKNYNALCEMMNIQSYIDCYCANIYLADGEWPANGTYMWKSDEFDEGKWQFFLEDLDYTTEINRYSTNSINTYLRPYIANDWFLNSLMRNDNFKAKFEETMEKMATVIFTEERVAEAAESLKGAYEDAVITSFARFSGNMSESAFESNLDSIVSFFGARKDYIDIYTKEYIDKITIASNVNETLNDADTDAEEESLDE